MKRILRLLSAIGPGLFAALVFSIAVAAAGVSALWSSVPSAKAEASSGRH